MALYNKFGLSLFGFASGNHFQLKSQKFGIVLFQVNNLGLLRADVQTETLFQPVFCCIEQLNRIWVTILVNILKLSAYRTQVISFSPLLRRDAYLLP